MATIESRKWNQLWNWKIYIIIQWLRLWLWNGLEIRKTSCFCIDKTPSSVFNDDDSTEYSLFAAEMSRCNFFCWHNGNCHEQGLCLHQGVWQFVSQFILMTIKINSHFSISHMISGGMFDYWERNELRKAKLKNNKKLNDNDNDDQQIKPLTIVQLQSAFYLFIIGIVTSIMLFTIETTFFINQSLIK